MVGAKCKLRRKIPGVMAGGPCQVKRSGDPRPCQWVEATELERKEGRKGRDTDRRQVERPPWYEKG